MCTEISQSTHATVRQRFNCLSFHPEKVSSRLPVFIISPTQAVDASPIYLGHTACQSAAAAIDSTGNAFRHLPYETIERGVERQLLTSLLPGRVREARAAAPVAGMMEIFPVTGFHTNTRSLSV